MELSRLLLLLVALTAIAGTSEGQASTFYTSKCYPPPTPTADGGSAFRGHLLGLLADLPSAAAPTGFASLQTAGRAASDRALVRGLCFGESAPEQCRRCLSEAGYKIIVQCGDASRRAGFWSERCFLGYADGTNTSSSAGADDMGAVIYFSGDAVASPEVAGVRILVSLAQYLAPRAATGSVATANTTTPSSNGDATTGDRTVRVLAQCARDRGAAECVGCLREASLSMAKSWGRYAVEGRVAAVLGSSCYLRFEIWTLQPLLRRCPWDWERRSPGRRHADHYSLAPAAEAMSGSKDEEVSKKESLCMHDTAGDEGGGWLGRYGLGCTPAVDRT
uniref:Uncharacterized protein n=1 Tax=Avena sativa TaxID=4498 RepID=A0ACD5US47_AVESA